MMNKFLIILMCLELAGCVSSVDYARFTNIEYPPKREQDEVLLSVKSPSRPYIELGIIKVHGSNTTPIDIINKKIMAKAKEVGADAIINLSYSQTGINLVGIGTAIVFTDK